MAKKEQSKALTTTDLTEEVTSVVERIAGISMRDVANNVEQLILTRLQEKMLYAVDRIVDQIGHAAEQGHADHKLN